MRENETEAGKARWVLWVWPDGPDDVGGPVGQRWGRPDKDGDGRTKMGTNPDTILLHPVRRAHYRWPRPSRQTSYVCPSTFFYQRS